MKSSLLFGNGINLLNNKTPKWNELLKKINDGVDVPEDAPLTLQYESVLLNKLQIAKKSIKKYDNTYNLYKLIDEGIRSKIKESLGCLSYDDIYNDIIDLGFNNYLTTNYDKEFYINEPVDSYLKETKFNVRRHLVFFNERGSYNLWKIHGDVEKLKSIMLGHVHYCESISNMDDYIEGKKTYVIENINVKIPSILDKIKSNNSSDNYVSWIDLFFFTHIHIIGFGLDYGEVDLWYLLGKRAFLKEEYAAKIENKIFLYKLTTDDHQDTHSKLLISLGVEIVEFNKSEYQDENNNLNYRQFYKDAIVRIRENSTNDHQN